MQKVKRVMKISNLTINPGGPVFAQLRKDPSMVLEWTHLPHAKLWDEENNQYTVRLEVAVGEDGLQCRPGGGPGQWR